MYSLNKHTHSFESSLVPKPFIHGFATRQAGDARSKDDVAHYFLSIPTINEVHGLHQIHSTQIYNVDSSKSGLEGDGMISTHSHTALYVKTADCVPVILLDPLNKTIGISHQGWKGTLNNMMSYMIDEFIKKGSRAHDIIVLIGPSIGPCCYTFDQVRADLFLNKYQYPEMIYKDTTYHLDLQHLNVMQALEKGIQKEHIDICRLCTKDNQDLFFSYRRDGKENLGLNMSYIAYHD